MIYHSHRSRQPAWTPENMTHNSLCDLAETVEDAVQTLAEHADDFDTIVVTGLSGITVGVPVALALNKPVVILRKQGEQTHGSAGHFANQKDLGSRVLFLDDFTCMGETRARIVERIEARAKIEERDIRIVAEYWYRDDDYISFA